MKKGYYVKCLQVVVTVCRGVEGKHDNFCRPLEDYGPREDKMEERNVCTTTFIKECKSETHNECLDVTELNCEVRLFFGLKLNNF